MVKINIKPVNNLIKLHGYFNKILIFVQKNIAFVFLKVYNFILFKIIRRKIFYGTAVSS